MRVPVEVLLEQARAVDPDAIVVTDHDAIPQSLKAAALAPAYGLIGIPGAGTSTARGRLLAIGVTELPPAGETLDATIETIHDLGGVAVVPHPFQRSWHGIGKRRLGGCRPDAIEVYDPWLITGYENRRAKRFARRREYPRVAGSDAHLARMVGRAYTEIPVGAADRRETITAAEVVAALKSDETAIHDRRQPIHRSARHYLVGATRKTGRALRHGVTAFLRVPSSPATPNSIAQCSAPSIRFGVFDRLRCCSASVSVPASGTRGARPALVRLSRLDSDANDLMRATLSGTMADRPPSGEIFGVPYNFEQPSLGRMLSAYWQPGEDMLVQKPFGVGYTLNLASWRSWVVLGVVAALRWQEGRGSDEARSEDEPVEVIVE